jgi:hypothetical protein
VYVAGEDAIEGFLARRAAAAAAKKAAQALAAAITACLSVYAAYKALEPTCGACQKCDTEPILLTKLACWEAVENLRSSYLSRGCDYILEGSIKVGSAGKVQDHTDTLVTNTQGAIQNCYKWLKHYRIIASHRDQIDQRGLLPVGTSKSHDRRWRLRYGTFDRS